MTRAVTNIGASRVPRMSAGCDIRTLPIGPHEAFLLSRIDGSTSERDLIALTGLTEEAVAEMLGRLEQLGAITFAGAPPRTATNAASLEAAASGALGRAFGTEVDPEAADSKASTPGARPRPADLDEAADLPSDKKQEILETFQTLSLLDYYELLGVGPEASRKDLRKAYYARAPGFHPDRFFGKNLGAYKSRLEAVFTKLTLAYETLSNPERRAEYDTYLANAKATAEMEQLLHGPVVLEAEARPKGAPGDPLAAARAPESGANLPSGPVVTVASEGGSMGNAALRTGPPSDPSSGPPESLRSAQLRREMLARKLHRSSPPESRGTAMPISSSNLPIAVPAGSGTSAPDEAAASWNPMNDLRRLREQAVQEGQKVQVRRFVEAARAAAAQDQAAAAANAFRLALALDPGNLELQAAYQAAARAAAVRLADGYLKQAEYEARTANWAEAARSYVRAAAGMPNDHEVQHKTAVAILRANGDMRQAVSHAQRAIELAPKRVDPHVTLAEIYLVAGRPLLAKRELDTARELAPQDDRIKELLKRLR